jgi:hypothetical protein
LRSGLTIDRRSFFKRRSPRGAIGPSDDGDPSCSCQGQGAPEVATLTCRWNGR